MRYRHELSRAQACMEDLHRTIRIHADKLGAHPDKTTEGR